MKGIANVFVLRMAEGDQFEAGALIFYPNLMTGTEKLKEAVKIPLDRNDDSVSFIIDKISDAYESKYMPVVGMVFNEAVL